MDIKQKAPNFSPITITLETSKEAESFWQIMLSAEKNGVLIGTQKDLAIKISDYFTSFAHL